MSIDPMTIVFALVAIFVCWRLYSVLGTRNGAERPPLRRAGPARVGGDIVDVTPAPPPPAADRWRGVAERGTPLAAGLDAVASGDASFDAAHFLDGARAAYEMIVHAFAEGDVEALRNLLGPEPLAEFTQAIASRRAAGQQVKVTLVSLDRAELVGAEARDAAAFVTVRFASKMTSVTTDASGTTVEGSATEVADHVDVWTFSRPFAARDPNWRLTATHPTH